MVVRLMYVQVFFLMPFSLLLILTQNAVYYHSLLSDVECSSVGLEHAQAVCGLPGNLRA
jgi:hypothetical protein